MRGGSTIDVGEGKAEEMKGSCLGFSEGYDRLLPNKSLHQTPASLAASLRSLALRAAAELRRYAASGFNLG